jgi:hypothetical protein
VGCDGTVRGCAVSVVEVFLLGNTGRGGVIHSSTHPAGGRICSVVAAGVVAVNVLVICLPTRLLPL